MNRSPVPSMLVLAAALLVAPAADAHRSWLLPSSTVLSGDDLWITVDAAVSNELFYFDHNPGRLAGLVITAPDGSKIQPENISTGKYRSTFDVHLAAKGTYKVAIVNDALMASYTLDGETKRWRGSADRLRQEIPANAQNVRVTRALSRQETFVTAGQPSDTVFAPSGAGLELVPITHPNDLFAGEAARFRLLLDGKPAPELKVTIIRGGVRYRNALEEIMLTTDRNGEFEVTWPQPGMYWLNATTGNRQRPGEPPAAAARPAGATAANPDKRASYSATLEVFPQ